MKLKKDTLTEAAKLASAHPCVEDLLNFYKYVSSNPVYESYIARMVTMNKWNEELIKHPVSIISDKKSEQDKTDKEVERVKKYFLEQPLYLKGTNEIRAMLMPEEQERAAADKRASGSPDLAF